MKFNELSKKLGNSIAKHSPEILMGFGITGLLTTTVLAVKATPKAMKLIEEKKKEDNVEKLSVKETVKTTWKCYAPAGTLAVVSTVCLIGSCTINAKRNVVLATAYKIAETAHNEYREKVIETIGTEQEKVVRDKVAKSKIEQTPTSETKVIVTDLGNTLCFDKLSGRYFRADVNRIEKIVNDLNRDMVFHNYVSLNDFYDELGLDRSEIGDLVGWNINSGFIEIDFSSQLSDKNEPCLVLIFNRAPQYDFAKFF